MENTKKLKIGSYILCFLCIENIGMGQECHPHGAKRSHLEIKVHKKYVQNKHLMYVQVEYMSNDTRS